MNIFLIMGFFIALSLLLWLLSEVLIRKNIKKYKEDYHKKVIPNYGGNLPV